MPRLVGRECSATALLVAGLLEFDRRRLYLPLGYPSMFQYCLKHLKLTEDATFNRLEAARAARKFPRILVLLRTGELSLTATRLLAPHLTEANAARVIDDARHKTKREIELLIAAIAPQAPVPSVIRKLPSPRRIPDARSGAYDDRDTVLVDEGSRVESSDTQHAPATTPVLAPPASHRPVIAPLSPAHYKLQVTISAAARERLGQIQGLMRHRLPNGDPAAIVEHALDVLHAQLLKEKAAEVAKPRAGKGTSNAKGRYIPASVKREVWRRDEGRCAFVADNGQKCGSTNDVEFHHVQPHCTGGPPTVANLEMRCRAHNGFEWQRHLEEESLAFAQG